MYLCKHQVITIIKWSHLLPCGSTKVCHTNGGKELQYLLKRQYLSITRRETQKDSFVQYLYECTMSSVIVCMSTTLFCQDLSKEQWETWQFTQQVQRAKNYPKDNQNALCAVQCYSPQQRGWLGLWLPLLEIKWRECTMYWGHRCYSRWW